LPFGTFVMRFRLAEAAPIALLRTAAVNLLGNLAFNTDLQQVQLLVQRPLTDGRRKLAQTIERRLPPRSALHAA
jgi:hypothetical protein